MGFGIKSLVRLMSLGRLLSMLGHLRIERKDGNYTKG